MLVCIWFLSSCKIQIPKLLMLSLGFIIHFQFLIEVHSLSERLILASVFSWFNIFEFYSEFCCHVLSQCFVKNIGMSSILEITADSLLIVFYNNLLQFDHMYLCWASHSKKREAHFQQLYISFCKYSLSSIFSTSNIVDSKFS